MKTKVLFLLAMMAIPSAAEAGQSNRSAFWWLFGGRAGTSIACLDGEQVDAANVPPDRQKDIYLVSIRDEAVSTRGTARVLDACTRAAKVRVEQTDANTRAAVADRTFDLADKRQPNIGAFTPAELAALSPEQLEALIILNEQAGTPSVSVDEWGAASGRASLYQGRSGWGGAGWGNDADFQDWTFAEDSARGTRHRYSPAPTPAPSAGDKSSKAPSAKHDCGADLATCRKDLAATSGVLANREAELDQKDGTIAALEAEIAAQGDVITSLNATVASRSPKK